MVFHPKIVQKVQKYILEMVLRKFTSYRGQGEFGVQRFPGKILKEKNQIFSGKLVLPQQIISKCGLKMYAIFP